MPAELVELCQRATNLANSISTRIVEYLAATKGQSHGFRDLAIKFLEVCQTLWPIQAGLLDASRTTGQLPPEVTLELKGKVNQTIDDFTSLDLLLSKLLVNERKKGFSKLSKGLNLMFVDGEVHKLTVSLTKDRDTLRMGSLAFKWLLGDTSAHSPTGNAYTALVAALKAANGQKLLPYALKPQLQTPAKETASTKAATLSEDSISERHPHKLPPLPDWQSNSLENSIVQPRSPTHLSPDPDDHRTTASSMTLPNRTRQREFHLPTPRQPFALDTEKTTTRSATREVPDFSPESLKGTLSDTASQTTIESIVHFEEMLKSYDYDRASMIKAKTPRVTVRPVGMSVSPPSRAALVAALHQKNHKVLEDLLDTGISSDTISEHNLLGYAVSNADTASCRLLLLHGADPNGMDAENNTPLSQAVKSQTIEVASLLLRYGADSNLPAGSALESPLSKAVLEGRIEHVELFVKHGGDTDALLPDGDTSFIKAMRTGVPLGVVELMLSSGADPNKKSAHGESPLIKALMARRVDIVSSLLDHGANPNLAGPKHPLWPATYEPRALQLLLARGAKTRLAPGIMELAASLNCIDSVSILLKAHVDPNVKKDGVYTPLCSAIRDDRSSIVTLLLSNGADPNIPASEYPAFKCITHDRLHFLPQLVAAGVDLSTPRGIVETAVAHKKEDAVKFLLNSGVSPNDRNSEGHTPLTTAIREGLDEYVKLLLEYGANPGVRGEDWPLCMAVKKPAILAKILPAMPNLRNAKGIVEMAVVAGQLDSVKQLLKAGFSVEDKTGGVFSPLTSSIREERKEIVRFLLDEAGADINAPGEHLPVVKALRRCRGSHDTEVLEMLLARGADINLIYRGWNGVMQAIERGDADILRLLLEKGNKVDLQAADETGKTVLEFAQERGWDEGADILLDAQR